MRLASFSSKSCNSPARLILSLTPFLPSHFSIDEAKGLMVVEENELEVMK